MLRRTVIVPMTHAIPSPTMPPNRLQPSRPSAKNKTDLNSQLRKIVGTGPVTSSLPTTRTLGQRFGVSNTTVFRALQRLMEDGVLWQHPNGRYYPAASQALLDRPQPVACLMRRLELCSELYRELLEGISAGCGAHRRTMLLWHDELLVTHADVAAPPAFASISQQRAILADFLDRHGDTAGGFVLDHAWRDEVLQEQAARLPRAVVLFRSCPLKSLGNVRADFRAGALMALTHLLARGYEQITPVEPFENDPAVEEFLGALADAVDELGCGGRVGPPTKAGTAEQRQLLVEQMHRAKRRTALLFPEDSIAIMVLEAARVAGVRCPEDVGFLSAQGTDFALKTNLSCLRYDYRAMGRIAVDVMSQSETVHHACAPKFRHGATT